MRLKLEILVDTGEWRKIDVDSFHVGDTLSIYDQCDVPGKEKRELVRIKAEREGILTRWVWLVRRVRGKIRIAFPFKEKIDGDKKEAEESKSGKRGIALQSLWRV